MGNWCPKDDGESNSSPPENEEPHTPLIRSAETPPMPDMSVDKIKEGLSATLKRSKTDASAAQSEKEEKEREKAMQEERRLEKERLEKQLEEKFLQEEEAKRKKEEQQRQNQEKQRAEIARMREEEERLAKERLAREQEEQEKIMLREREARERQEQMVLAQQLAEEKLKIAEHLMKEKEAKNEKLKIIEGLNNNNNSLNNLNNQNTIVQTSQHDEQDAEDTKSTDETEEPTSSHESLELLENFPKEIYRILFSFLPRADRAKVRLLSKFWKDLVDKSGTVVFILNDVTCNLSAPNMIVDDHSLEMGEDRLRVILGKNTTITHIVFKGSKWTPSKAARVLINNATIVEDAAFRVSAHCSTEEFQDLEHIRKRNVAFLPCRLILSQTPNFEAAYNALIEKFGPSIGPTLMGYTCITGMHQFLKFLLDKGISPLQAISIDIKDSPLVMAIRKNEEKVIQILEEHYGGPLIGWHGKTIERTEVESLMKGKPTATFLTRYSSRAGSYVISRILPSGVIEHMNKIFPEKDGRVRVENNEEGVRIYPSFPEYIYKTCMLRDKMYCLYPLPSSEKFQEVQ